MADKTKKHLFPKGFLWGASTAAHQVEGDNINQWSVWELENASNQAKTAKKRLDWMPKWDDIATKAQDPNNYISGNGIEHYDRYKADFKLAKELNLNSFRFGIEWSRVEPEEGVWVEKEWQHYRDYIQELLDQDLEPILNLWHWTMPAWFTDKGGFEKRKNIKYFERFVKKVCEEVQIKDIKYVLTMNEPNNYAMFGYLTGEWPPSYKNKGLKFLKVYYNLAVAHNRAYDAVKSSSSGTMVSAATQLANMQAKRPRNVFDNFATWWMRYFYNWWWINKIKRHQDFLGFNYYFTDYYRFGNYKQIKSHDLFHQANPKVPKNDLGWYMEPEGLHSIIVRAWAHYKKPIMITENGLADMHDENRKWWIEESIVALERAISEDIEVIGYLHWSLLDNFEWAYGWWPQFGLIHVDRKTMKRTVRPSAKYYAEKIAECSE